MVQKGGGGQKSPNFCAHGLWMTPTYLAFRDLNTILHKNRSEVGLLWSYCTFCSFLVPFDFCERPPSISHGFMVTAPENVYRIWTEIYYECHPGYKMKATNSLKCHPTGKIVNWISLRKSFFFFLIMTISALFSAFSPKNSTIFQ